MKVKKKGAVALGLLVASGILALAGCSGSTTAQPTTSGDAQAATSGELTVWVDADRARALEDVAKKFEQEKGVKVNLVVKDYGKIRDEFTAQVPTGKGPDITIGGHDWIGAFVKDGIVAPVELGDKAADFEKVAIEAVTYDGKTYGLPYAIENIAVLRNTALADSTPATYDMIAKAAPPARSTRSSWAWTRRRPTRTTCTRSRPPSAPRSSGAMPMARTTRASCRSATRADRSSPRGSPRRETPAPRC
jgi:arabinogalactan oligomer/maltooligosaccharide transport system substrate-binding protein